MSKPQISRIDQEDFLEWAYGHGPEGDTSEEYCDFVAYGRPLVRARQFLVVHRLRSNPWPTEH